MKCYLFLCGFVWRKRRGFRHLTWRLGANQTAELPFPVEWVEVRHPGSWSGAARAPSMEVTSSSSLQSWGNWDSWSPASPHQLAPKAPLLGSWMLQSAWIENHQLGPHCHLPGLVWPPELATAALSQSEAERSLVGDQQSLPPKREAEVDSYTGGP